MAVCCGQGWVAAATDRRNFKGCSQRYPVASGVFAWPNRLPGRPQRHHHHRGSRHAFLATSSMERQYFNVRGGPDSVALSELQTLPPRAKVQPLRGWVTDEGVPCVADSAGFIRVFTKGSGRRCATPRRMPRTSTKHYFVVVSASTSLTPGATWPRGQVPADPAPPVVALVPGHGPVPPPDQEKSNLEHQFFKSQLLTALAAPPAPPPRSSSSCCPGLQV